MTVIFYLFNLQIKFEKLKSGARTVSSRPHLILVLHIYIYTHTITKSDTHLVIYLIDIGGFRQIEIQTTILMTRHDTTRHDTVYGWSTWIDVAKPKKSHKRSSLNSITKLWSITVCSWADYYLLSKNQDFSPTLDSYLRICVCRFQRDERRQSSSVKRLSHHVDVCSQSLLSYLRCTQYFEYFVFYSIHLFICRLLISKISMLICTSLFVSNQ